VLAATLLLASCSHETLYDSNDIFIIRDESSIPMSGFSEDLHLYGIEVNLDSTVHQYASSNGYTVYGDADIYIVVSDAKANHILVKPSGKTIRRGQFEWDFSGFIGGTCKMGRAFECEVSRDQTTRAPIATGS